MMAARVPELSKKVMRGWSWFSGMMVVIPKQEGIPQWRGRVGDAECSGELPAHMQQALRAAGAVPDLADVLTAHAVDLVVAQRWKATAVSVHRLKCSCEDTPKPQWQVKIWDTDSDHLGVPRASFTAASRLDVLILALEEGA